MPGNYFFLKKNYYYNYIIFLLSISAIVINVYKYIKLKINLISQKFEMDRSAKEAGLNLVLNDLNGFHQTLLAGLATIEQLRKDHVNFIRDLGTQIGNKRQGLLPKTPKRKRYNTIPENEEVLPEENDTDETPAKTNDEEPDKEEEEEEVIVPRSRRGASVKANEKIKKQQSITLNAKLRRPSHDEDAMEVAVVVNITFILFIYLSGKKLKNS